MNRLLFTAYFLEVGMILILVPWSRFWDHNYFAQSVPLVHDFIRNDFVRGAVSGVGVLNLVAGLADLRALLPPWRR